MAEQTSIEWTDATWNPITGCTKISPGCKNCYDETIGDPSPGYGESALSERLQYHAAARPSDSSPSLAPTQAHLRQQHERPIPRHNPRGVHPSGLRG